MHKIVLEVTHGPKWSAQENRYLQNGERVTLEATSEEALRRLVARHAHHCKTIIEGELPRALVRPATDFQRPDGDSFTSKVKKVLGMGPKETPEEPSEAPKEAKKEPVKAPKKPKKQAPEGAFPCARCGQGFTSKEGLAVHYRNSKHDTPEE